MARPVDEQFYEMGDDLGIAADNYKWFAELVRTKQVNAKQKRRMLSLLKRADRLISALLDFKTENEDLPSWNAGSQQLEQ